MANLTQSPVKLHSKSAFKCPFCFKIFIDRTVFIKHLASHKSVERTGNGKKTILSEAPLPQCYVRLNRCDSLLLNQCLVKPEISGDKQFGLKKPLKSFKIRTRKREVFRCTKCSKTYLHKSSLNLHLRNHTGKRPYRCSSCDRAFTRANHLKLHVMTHSGKMPYQCTFCNRAFTRLYQLKIHVMTHICEKPYHCKICDYSCIEFSTLKRHYIIHKGIKPLKCCYCDYRFARKDNLKNHYKSFHKLTNLQVINS